MLTVHKKITNYALSALCAMALGLGTPALAVPALTGEAGKSTSPNISSAVMAPATPYKVVLNQQNARAFAQSTVRIEDLSGQKTLYITLPKNASDVQLHIPDGDASLMAWQVFTDLPFAAQSAQEIARQQRQNSLDTLEGTLSALYAHYNSLYEPVLLLTPAEAKSAMEAVLPELSRIATKIEQVKREKELLQQSLSAMKGATKASQKLAVTIDSKKAVGSEIRLAYSYTLNDSKWTPVYTVNANSEANTINFKLMAHITQQSDLDWNATEIEFSTSDGNEQSPPPVNPWIVRKRGEEQVMMSRAAYDGYAEMAAPAMKSSNAIGDFNGENTLTTWTLAKKISLPAGETTLILQEETLKAPLQRIARPSAYNGTKVWLSAKHKLISPFLPVGQTTYLLDNIPVGEGFFAIKNEEMQFFFGVDPLVSVDVKKDIRKSAEDGIISKDNVWTWGWTYTVLNKRNQAVQVRLEEPETQLSDKAMSVTYKDSPAATKEAEHLFIWNLTIPAQGQSVVKRSVTVKAPKDMPVNPGR